MNLTSQSIDCANPAPSSLSHKNINRLQRFRNALIRITLGAAVSLLAALLSSVFFIGYLMAVEYRVLYEQAYARIISSILQSAAPSYLSIYSAHPMHL
jgi:hypothetical protein